MDSGEKRISSVLRRVTGLVLTLFAILALYAFLDMRQAKQMAVEACVSADKGMLLDEFLTTIPEQDYRVIKGAREIIIVPNKGFGRNNCIVSHDGLKIISAKVNFVD
jgi:hypothetical protein